MAPDRQFPRPQFSFQGWNSPETTPRTPDTPEARADDEEQAIGTFYNSHGEVEELAKLLNAVLRTPQMAPPRFVANSATNSLTVRATTSVLGIPEQVIAANDTPAGGDHHRRRGGASGAWTTTPSSTPSPSRA